MRRWKPKVVVPPLLAPPTKFAAVDGSHYRPRLAYERLVKTPGVPTGPRLNSAKRIIQNLEERRQSKMNPAALANPQIRVAVLLERLPVIQLALTSWQLDFEAAKAFKYEEERKALPRGMLDVWPVNNPPWVIDMFRGYFRHYSDSLLAFVNTDPETADKITVIREEEVKLAKLMLKDKDDKSKKGAKTKKQKKKEEEETAVGEEEGIAGGESKSSAPSSIVTELLASQDGSGEPKKSEAKVIFETQWHKEMSELGIELEFVETPRYEELEKKPHFSSLQEAQEAMGEFTYPRTTEADEKKDLTSLDRKLECKLYMVIKPKGKKWTFPSVVRNENESLVKAAERAVFSLFDKTERAEHFHVVSMVPSGYRVQDTMKEFFLRTQLIRGDFSLDEIKDKSIQEVRWLTPWEIGELFLKENNEDKDEVMYLIRMIGDDWWIEPDCDELSPKRDRFAQTPLKNLKKEEIKARLEEENQRRQVIMEGLMAKFSPFEQDQLHSNVKP